MMRGVASALKRQASIVTASAAFLLLPPLSAGSVHATKAPEFPSREPSRWVGAPVRLEELRGEVVLLDVWTFG
jgi:hypothetical protein